MTKMKELIKWIIFMETLLITGAQHERVMVTVEEVNGNYSCVDVSWTSTDTSKSYKYQITCTGADIISGVTKQTQRVCGDYGPYTSVNCSVSGTETSGGGLSVARTGSGTGWTSCAEPSLPTFEVREEIGYWSLPNGESVKRRKIVVYNVEVENVNCGSITDVFVRAFKTGKLSSESGDVSEYKIDEFYNLNNLDAVTEYKVVVEVYTDNADRFNNYITAAKYITTGQLPPGPVRDLTASSSSQCVHLTWLVPSVPGGKILYYTVNCTSFGKQDFSNTTTVTEIDICSYNVYWNVSCSVAAINEFNGTSTSLNTRRKCEPPSISQYNVTEYISDDGTHRIIKVDDISVTANCLQLTNRTVSLKKNSRHVDIKKLTDGQTGWTFINLDAITEYVVEVRAFNSDDKSSVNFTHIRTGELAPGPPEGLHLRFENSCVIVNWRQPIKHNGVILGYNVKCQDANVTFNEILTANIVQKMYCGFQPATNTSCSVSANNSIGWSSDAISFGLTTPNTRNPVEPAHSTPDGDVIKVKIDQISFLRTDLKLQHYQIVVQKIESGRRKKRQLSNIDINELHNVQTAQSMGLPYYVAGRTSDHEGETIEFTCGDDKMYEGFHNIPLEKNEHYKIHYTYTVNLDGQEQMYFVESSESYYLEGSNDVPTILGVVVPLIIILAVIVGLIIWCRMKSKM